MRAARVLPGRGSGPRKVFPVLQFSRWPLRVKLAAFVVIVTLLPIAVLAIAEVSETRHRMLHDEAQLLAARAEQLVAEIDAFHLGYRRAAARLAAMPKIGDLVSATPDEQDALRGPMMSRVAIQVAVDPAIRGIAIAGADRRVIAATEPALDRRVLRWRFVADALAGHSVISDVFVSEHEVGDVPTIGYASPVRGPGGEILGAVVFWLAAGLGNGDAERSLAERLRELSQVQSEIQSLVARMLGAGSPPGAGAGGVRGILMGWL